MKIATADLIDFFDDDKVLKSLQWKYFTMKEVREHLRISQKSLRKLLQQNKLLFVQFGRKKVLSEYDLRMYEREVRELAKQQQRGSKKK